MTALPAAGYWSDNARTQAQQKQWGEDIRSVIAEMLGGSAEASYTIASGAITPTVGVFSVDTEAAAVTDDLTTLVTTNFPIGRLALLRSVDPARDVVVKHNAGGGAKFIMSDGADLTLDDPTQYLLVQRRGADWYDVLRGYGSNKTAARAYLGLAIGTNVQAYDANTAKLNAVQTWSAIQTIAAAARGTPVSLTDGATVTPNFNLGNHFYWTIGGNRTLANPSNINQGQGGVITITQDGTGGRTISFGSAWKFEGGTIPTLSTAAGAVDELVYYVEQGSSRICAALMKDVK